MRILRVGRLVLSGIAALACSAALLVGTGLPASADGGCAWAHFCAFADRDFHTVILSSFTNGPTSMAVDVDDNATSSASNLSGETWIGKNKRGTFHGDETAYVFAPHSDVAFVGDTANDKIDYFLVK